jgi:tRNA-Thr(GGU) m(6)t(6)A37 methyltransferase TsaA
VTPNPDELRLHPIGHLRSPAERKYQLSPQPADSDRIEGVVELSTGHNYDVALRDLDGFSRIWLVWWFHKNDNWRPTTLPPRGRTGRKGTFASRSPYRPNPLGLSNVKLLEVSGHHLYIGAHDLLDDTPILDIKPYIPEFDSFPQESAGWYQEMKRNLPDSPYQVQFDEQARVVLTDEPSLQEQLVDVLSLDPYPHRTRRIVNYENGYRIACGDWRAYFSVESHIVRVERVALRSS